VSAAALQTLICDGLLSVRVTPKASANRIRIETQDDGNVRVRVDVTVVPEDGKANDAVIKQVSKALGVPKSAITIMQGQTSRDKLLKIKM
jgi:uncharacterized protein